MFQNSSFPGAGPILCLTVALKMRCTKGVILLHLPRTLRWLTIARRCHSIVLLYWTSPPLRLPTSGPKVHHHDGPQEPSVFVPERKCKSSTLESGATSVRRYIEGSKNLVEDALSRLVPADEKDHSSSGYLCTTTVLNQ